MYLGSKGNEALLPDGAYINYRDFKSPSKLLAFLRGMSEAEHAGYVDKIDAFLASEGPRYFTTVDMYRIIFEQLVGGEK